MTHIELKAFKLIDISKNPIEFYPQLIKGSKGNFGITEDYVFFQTSPLALIRINKPTHDFCKMYNLDFAVLLVTCEEEGLARQVINEITEKIKPFFKRVYDEPLDYLRKIGNDAAFMINALKKIS